VRIPGAQAIARRFPADDQVVRHTGTVKSRKLAMACPVCGSAEVFYSCTPNCCFNHVCAGCGATFEPATKLGAGRRPGILPPDPLPEAADPTVACVKCDSVKVYELEDRAIACAGCGAVLEIEYTEISG
jgi:ribosomal protein S27E